MSTASNCHDWHEAFRRRAVELAHRGWSQTAIADALGMTQSAVSKWLKLAHTQGLEALRPHPHPGRPPQLTADHLTELRRLLEQGAPAHGFVGEVWTGTRVATLIARHFLVTVSARHARRILHQLGWTRQTPVRHAEQRNEPAIARWLRKRWPRLKHAARRAHRTILFVDETGVYLVPSVVKTWAPRGETPVLHEHLSKEHLSLISAVTPSGEVYYQLRRRAYDSAAVIEFLEELHAQVPGKLLVIWDGAPIHHRQEIQDYLDQGASAWLRLEQLPGYAPELNPDEAVWNYLKRVELHNVSAMTVAVLEAAVIVALQHIMSQPTLIQAFFRHAGLA
jgi:transposase